MKKVYILGKGHDDEATIYGVFSTQKKAEKAYDVFSAVEEDLWISDYKLDEPEKYFQDILDGYRWYHFWQSKYAQLVAYLSSYGQVHVTEGGLNSFIDGRKENIVWDSEVAVWATIRAKSEEEARELFEKKLEIARSTPEKLHTWK